MITKGKSRSRRSKEDIRIPREDWELLRKNPAFGELVELIEDRYDLEAAKAARGKGMSLIEYLKRRGLQNNH